MVRNTITKREEERGELNMYTKRTEQKDVENRIMEQARTGVWLDITEQAQRESELFFGLTEHRRKLCRMKFDGEHVTFLEMSFDENDTYPELVSE